MWDIFMWDIFMWDIFKWDIYVDVALRDNFALICQVLVWKTRWSLVSQTWIETENCWKVHRLQSIYCAPLGGGLWQNVDDGSGALLPPRWRRCYEKHRVAREGRNFYLLAVGSWRLVLEPWLRVFYCSKSSLLRIFDCTGWYKIALCKPLLTPQIRRSGPMYRDPAIMKTCENIVLTRVCSGSLHFRTSFLFNVERIKKHSDLFF